MLCVGALASAERQTCSPAFMLSTVFFAFRSIGLTEIHRKPVETQLWNLELQIKVTGWGNSHLFKLDLKNTFNKLMNVSTESLLSLFRNYRYNIQQFYNYLNICFKAFNLNNWNELINNSSMQYLCSKYTVFILLESILCWTWAEWEVHKKIGQ